MDLYDVRYEDATDGDLYAISIVEDPANGFQFITLSKEKELVKMSSEKKKILTGVVLVPNQKIYRNMEGQEFNLTFNENTILRLSQDFLIKGYQKNSTYNHSDKFLKGISTVESWIVEDPKNDKSNALGFSDLPKGTWMVSRKLSDELWAEYIETGKAKGFSIDSFLDLQKITMNVVYNNENNTNKIKTMKKPNLLKRVIQFFVEEQNLASIEIEGMGTLTADAFEKDNVVYKDVDGALEPLVSSSFTYDGFIYVTDEKGTIVSKDVVVEVTDTLMPTDIVTPLEMEDVPTDATSGDTQTVQMEDVVSTEVTSATTETTDVEMEDILPTELTPEEHVKVLEDKVAELEAQIEILTKQSETINSVNEDLKTQLSRIPNTTKLKANMSTEPKVETSMDVIRRVIEAGKTK